jgi:PAT family beta-lactamase induction signal transducer AmpG
LFSNTGYFFLSRLSEPSLLAMYSATGFELLTSGMGTGAFMVLLLRLTQKQFSATQYALFSSLFALPRILAGPITGFAVDALGWSTFFLCTMAIGIPGLVMLARFVPFGVRDPDLDVDEHGTVSAPFVSPALVARGAIGGAVVAGFAIIALAGLDALSVMRSTPAVGFDVGAALWRVLHPAATTDWVQVFGILAFALVGGLFVAARASVRQPAARS